MPKSKILVADTNIFLRFLLKDVKSQFEISKDLLEQAQKGKIEIVLRNEVVVEMCYVLEKLYKVGREEISQKVTVVLTTPYLEIEERDILLTAVEIFRKTKYDIIDCILFMSAYLRDRDILSFDKDLKNLKNMYSEF